jgi:hypothetical protein
VTDPDRRNITDQRYHGDAELRYQVGNSRPRTQAQWLDYFTEHYGKYEVLPPSAPGAQWHATALFGQNDQLFGWSPTELLDELIEHRFRNHATSEDRT